MVLFLIACLHFNRRIAVYIVASCPSDCNHLPTSFLQIEKSSLKANVREVNSLEFGFDRPLVTELSFFGTQRAKFDCFKVQVVAENQQH